MKDIVIELATPHEILKAIIIKVKEKQKLIGHTNMSISIEAGLGIKSYENFIYNNNISLINLIKLLKTLDMVKELQALISPVEARDPIEHKKLEHIRELRTKKAANKKGSGSRILKETAKLKLDKLRHHNGRV